MRNIPDKRKGFTLVELMVVTAIIGVLVAVAVPIYGSTVKYTKEKACEANILLIDGAVQQYLNTGYDGRPHTFTSACIAFGMTKAEVPALQDGSAAGPFPEEAWPAEIKASFQDGPARCPFDEVNGKYEITLRYNGIDIPRYTVTCTADHEK